MRWHWIPRPLACYSISLSSILRVLAVESIGTKTSFDCFSLFILVLYNKEIENPLFKNNLLRWHPLGPMCGKTFSIMALKTSLGTPPGFGCGGFGSYNMVTLFMTEKSNFVCIPCLCNQSEKAELPCSRYCLLAWWKTIPWIWQETQEIRKLSRIRYPVYDKKLEKPYSV